MYDGASGRRGVAPKTDYWYAEKGLVSIVTWNFFDLERYKSECLSDPNLCHQGLSLSFWLRYRRKYY